MAVRVAVDAMGGDRAPDEIIAGARAARTDGIEPILFGSKEVVQPLAPDLEVVHAPQVVGMHEKPADAAREKRDSSLFAACRAVGRGEADVVVSAGNTGAMLAAGLLEIGRLPEVSRPAIAAPIPARRGPSILIDAGANADARPEHLLQFAHMGTIFAEEIIGIRDPTVGLLSIGEEPEKGNRLTRESHRLLSADGIRLRRERRRAAPPGGRRGRRRLRRLHGQHVAQGARGHDPDGARVAPRGDRRLAGAGRSAVSWSARRFEALRRRLDPDTYGGGYLLGLKGLAVVAHGNSSRPAIVSAIQLGARGVTAGVVGRMAERLESRAVAAHR